MSDPVFRSDMLVEAMQHWGDDTTPIKAARLSTGTEAGVNPERDRGLLNALMREGHHVPFEHTGVTFRIEAPIFVTRQILKHRISSISEASGRYSEMDGVFYVPGPERPVKQVGKTMDYQFEQDDYLSDEAYDAITSSSRYAWGTYKDMLERGIAKEVARMVLPLNLYSTLWLTMNTRSLLNFFNLRSSEGEGHPQYEIVQVADQMLKIWAGLFPETAGVHLRWKAGE
jgi:thymidylate synthase (FAD)